MTTKKLIRTILQVSVIWLFYVAGGIQVEYFQNASPVAKFAFSIAVGLVSAFFVLYINRDKP